MTFQATYGVASINDFQVNTVVGKKGKATVSSISLDGRELVPTKRFWTSMRRKFKINRAFERYFPYTEIFDRITKVTSNDRVRYCIEETGRKPKLLAITSLNQPYVEFDNLVGLLQNPSSKLASSPTYTEGVVRSTHNTAVPYKVNIAGDTFSTQFVVDTPIDGYGKPCIYVSLLRQVCSNGAVGATKAFRTEIASGKGKDNIIFSLERAFQAFSNEEGHAALISRFESASNSWASVYEAMSLQKLLVKVHGSGGLKGNRILKINTEVGNTLNDIPVLNDFFKITGDMNRQFGVTNIDSITSKKQKTLPIKSKVYDLINFATEVATHHATAGGQRMLQGWVGNTLTREYDLEGLADSIKDYNDFFISDGVVAAEMADMNSIIGDDE